MNQEVLIERFFQTLVDGDRNAARSIVAETLEAGVPPDRLLTGLFWPVLNQIQKLYRADQLSAVAHHFATRLLRMLAAQAQARFVQAARNGRRILISCGASEPDELAASMAADLVEAAGFEVSFTGGGVPADEIMSQVGNDRPDVLLLYSSAAQDLPHIRRLIDKLHEINVCPDLQIVVGGGVYSRADGLAQEIGADLAVPDLADLTALLVDEAGKRATPDQRTVGRKRRSRSAA